MNGINVEALKINYKTIEQFQKFIGCGAEELSMKEDLETNFIEESSDSPFYGVYIGGLLVARMSIYYKNHHSYNIPIKGNYIELRKVEVLPEYQNKGLGKQLINFVKNLHLPIITVARIQSHHFFEKQGFIPIPEAEDYYYYL